MWQYVNAKLILRYLALGALKDYNSKGCCFLWMSTHLIVYKSRSRKRGRERRQIRRRRRSRRTRRRRRRRRRTFYPALAVDITKQDAVLKDDVHHIVWDKMIY
jgi:hypothetical protein